MRKTLLLLLLLATCMACEKKTEAPAFDVSPTSVDLAFVAYNDQADYGRAAAEPKITVNSELAWTAESSVDWILLSNRKGEGGKPEVLSFRVHYNVSVKGSPDRVGYITLSNSKGKATVEVRQSKEEKLSIVGSPNFATWMYVSKYAGEIFIPCTSTAKDGKVCDSITFSNRGGGNQNHARYENGKIVFSMQPLDEQYNPERRCEMLIWKYGAAIARYETIQVNTEDYLYTEKTEFNFAASNDPYEIVEIYSSTPWEVQKPDWIMINAEAPFSCYTANSNRQAYRTAVIQLRNNTTGADRHGEIVFSYGPQGRVKTYTIKINQSK